MWEATLLNLQTNMCLCFLDVSVQPTSDLLKCIVSKNDFQVTAAAVKPVPCVITHTDTYRHLVWTHQHHVNNNMHTCEGCRADYEETSQTC